MISPEVRPDDYSMVTYCAVYNSHLNVDVLSQLPSDQQISSIAIRGRLFCWHQQSCIIQHCRCYTILSYYFVNSHTLGSIELKYWTVVCIYLRIIRIAIFKANSLVDSFKILYIKSPNWCVFEFAKSCWLPEHWWGTNRRQLHEIAENNDIEATENLIRFLSIITSLTKSMTNVEFSAA